MFSEPVYENGLIFVSYVAKSTRGNFVIVPMCELALYTPCSVYSLLVLFKLSSKPNGFIKLHL